MKEIGGYLQLDELVNEPYHEDLLELNTGRNALLYLIKARNISKIYIPRFLCQSVTDMLIKEKIDFEYYAINQNFIPVFNKKLGMNDYLYIVNYYGQMTDRMVLEYKSKYENVIFDYVQSFFQKSVAHVDTLYSCRKYFGVPDGAYLSTESRLDEALEIDQSSTRMEHILGRFEGQASDYYNAFKKNDESFKELPLKKMSKLTRNILGAIDYEKILISRNKNYTYLHNELGDKNLLRLKFPEGPFAYPYYVENGIEVREKLAKEKIYIPTLWPNVLKENPKESIEYKFAANILPLPCDQRYNVNDMEIVVRTFKRNAITR